VDVARRQVHSKTRTSEFIQPASQLVNSRDRFNADVYHIMTPASDWPLFRIAHNFKTGRSQPRCMGTVLHEAYAASSVSTSRGQALFPSLSVLLYYINFPIPDHLSPYPHPPAYHIATHRLFTLEAGHI